MDDHQETRYALRRRAGSPTRRASLIAVDDEDDHVTHTDNSSCSDYVPHTEEEEEDCGDTSSSSVSSSCISCSSSDQQDEAEEPPKKRARTMPVQMPGDDQTSPAARRPKMYSVASDPDSAEDNWQNEQSSQHNDVADEDDHFMSPSQSHASVAEGEHEQDNWRSQKDDGEESNKRQKVINHEKITGVRIDHEQQEQEERERDTKEEESAQMEDHSAEFSSQEDGEQNCEEGQGILEKVTQWHSMDTTTDVCNCPPCKQNNDLVDYFSVKYEHEEYNAGDTQCVFHLFDAKGKPLPEFADYLVQRTVVKIVQSLGSGENDCECTVNTECAAQRGRNVEWFQVEFHERHLAVPDCTLRLNKFHVPPCNTEVWGQFRQSKLSGLTVAR